MEKGKFYEIPNMVTRDVIEDGTCADDLVDFIDEAKGEIPVMKYIPPYVIEEFPLSERQRKELSEYLRKDMAWKFKWFGEGKYIE